MGALAVATVMLTLLVRYARRTIQAREANTEAETAPAATVEPSPNA